MKRFASATTFTAILSVCVAFAQDSAWKVYDPGFRVLNITGDASQRLWICGTDESIAVSSDDGAHWESKHQRQGGGLLLTVAFLNQKFGYAAGTSGLLLMTEDGGTTWARYDAGTETILLASFSDPQHGLVRTRSALLFTADGGAHWQPVSAGQNADTLKTFTYTYSVAALDEKHMAVFQKRGSAAYENANMLATTDAGQTWRASDIPYTNLYSLVVSGGNYWAIGNEVIERQNHGGHAVARAYASTDGENWKQPNSDVSVCQLSLCQSCTAQGCLTSNGILARILGEKSVSSEFSPNQEVTAKWAATSTSFCFVGRQLQCTALRQTDKPHGEGPTPTAVAPLPLGAPPGEPPYCLSCEMERILIDPTLKGTSPRAVTLKLTVEIAPNGIVRSVAVADAPTPAIEQEIRRQVEQWLFEPYMKDGNAVAVKLSTIAQVNVIKPR